MASRYQKLEPIHFYRTEREPWQPDDWFIQSEDSRRTAAAEAQAFSAHVHGTTESAGIPPDVLAAVLRTAYAQISQVLGLQGLQREFNTLRRRVAELEGREEVRQREAIAQQEADTQFARELTELEKLAVDSNEEWYADYDLNSLFLDKE